MPLNDVSGNVKTTSDFRFFELRKIKICDQLSNESIKNIALSNNIIFIGTTDALKVVVVPLVFEFEWSPKITNEVLESYNFIIIPLSIKPKYLSICPGRGSILAAFGNLNSNPNQTQIQFFDLTNLNAVNADLKPFATIDLTQNPVELIYLDWHPEFNESLFVAVLSNGELISVGVNLLKKQAKLLCTLVHNEKITCVSWSPRGKQFVIGKENGQIIQLKHKDGCNFEEAKHIQPVSELAGLEVNSIKWCFTQLFVASFANTKDENQFNVKHITIYAPPKQQPVFNNHASICLENFQSNLKYKTDFIHFNNVIMCSTSFSSEIGVLVCEDIEKSLNSWSQLLLDDSFRIELPVEKNSLQTLSKGLAIYQGDTKIFRINDSETIGGRNCPLLMIINSQGVLCNYYVCYPKLTYPAILATKQLEFQQTTQPVQLNQMNSIKSQQPILANTQQTTTQTDSTASTQQPQNIQANQINQQQQQQILNQQIERAKLEQQQKQAAELAAKEAELQKEKERRQIIEENRAYLVAIDDELTQFTKIIIDSKEKFKKINNLIVGKEEEKRNIIDVTSDLEFENNQIKERLKGIDVELLENFLLENLEMAENAKCRAEKISDSKFNILFSKRPLDPATQRKLKELNKKIFYIETNLKEINFILDQQWKDYIIFEKGNKKQDKVSNLCLINQSLANHHRYLNTLENELRQIEPFIKWENENYKLNYKQKGVNKITNSLKKVNLEDGLDQTLETLENLDDENFNFIEIRRFTNKNRQKLQSILDLRPEIPIKKSSLPVDLNSAIMISAVSKAREKLKLGKKYNEKLQVKQQENIKTKIDSTKQQVNLPTNQLDKKLIEQQKLVKQIPNQQTVQQKRIQPQQTVKASSTFVPPLVNQQQPTLLNKTQSTQSPQKQPQLPQSVNKPITIPVNNQYNFSFGQLNVIDPSNKTSQIAFGVSNDSKTNLPSSIQSNVLQANQAKQIIKTTLPTVSSANIFTSNQALDKSEFTFKPTSDQLNLTFEKSSPNLLASTPIKNLTTVNQQQPKIDNTDSTVPILSNSLNQLSRFVDNLVNKHITVAQPILSSNKQDEAQNSQIASPKYEDISPPITPIDANKQTTNITSQVTPISTKPSEQNVMNFSFTNQLAALSKKPISTTVTTPLFPFASTTSVQTTSTQANNQTQASPPINIISSTTATITSITIPSKTIFCQSTTSTQQTTSTTQSSSFASQPISAFAQQTQNKPTQETQSTGIFGNNNIVATDKPNSNNNNQTADKPSTSVFANNNLNTGSIFGTPLPNTTSNIMNLSKKDDQLISSNSQVVQQLNSSSLTTQQTQMPSNNIQSTTSAFSSPIQPFSSQPISSSIQQPQTSNQTFGSFSMCSLGGPPNPENVNKNPFASNSANLQTTNPAAKNLFGTTTQQNLFSPASTTNQSNSVFGNASFNTSTSNPASVFGSPSAFGTQAQNSFNTSNTMLGAGKSIFGNPAMNNPQQLSTFAQAQQPSSPFQQTTNAFGSKSTFGQSPAFGAPSTFGGSPNSSFQFGSGPVFGSPAATTNQSFGSAIQHTGFESFASASNVPTFGSLNTGNSPFETISNQPQNTFGMGQPQAQQTNLFSNNSQFSGQQFSERRA